MRAFLVVVTLTSVALAGCISADDTVPESLEDPAPVSPFKEFPLPETITGYQAVDTVDWPSGGNGIWIDEERHVLLSSNGGGGFSLFNITDPHNVTELGTIGGVDYARDVDLVRWENMTYAVLSTGPAIVIVNITDVDSPEVLGTADAYKSHNLASIPGTPYVYSASGFAPDSLIPTLDLSDPLDPQWHVIEIPSMVNGMPVQSDGCHDVVVRVDLDRAYCAGGGSFYVAGGGETLIMDISDPLNPTFIGHVDNPSIMYHHQAIASEDGDLLFINDEFIAPNCTGLSSPVGDRGQTTAAMWVYDISNPAVPILLSWLQPNVPGTVNCGSHFGDLVDGTSFLSWGWYDGGTLLIDVTDPTAPRVADRIEAVGSTWDARYFNGHVYGASGALQVMRIG